MTVAMLGILSRVIQLQVQPAEPVAELVNSQNSREVVHGQRGAVRDRHGRVLATTIPAKRLFIDPLLIRDPNTFAERVGYELGYDPAMIEKKLAPRLDTRYVVIDHRLDARRRALFRRMNLDGLAVQTHLVRHYPHGSLAGQVLGAVGREGVGLEGLERTLERPLSPQQGKLVFLRDGRRRPLWVGTEGFRAPADGRDIRLSLDLTLQSLAESALAQAVDRYDAESAQLIAMDPNTGEILAMANAPAFDPNQLTSSTPEMRRNRGVTDIFEPGSTFKPIVWAAATEAEAARPDEKIDTHEGYYTPLRLADAHPYDELTWEQVLVKSSNIGMAIVASRLPRAELYRAVKAFGFGQPTGSGLPGEVDGIVTPLQRWTRYSVSRIPMGHEVAVTPLQLVRAFGVFANDGFLVTPSILALSPREAPILEKVISTATAHQTRRVLRRVVTEGTGREARSDLYSIFGKTGTAHAPDLKNGGYLENAYVSSFVCGAPVDSPRLVVACVVRKPDPEKGYYGGLVAAPAARRFVEEALLYMQVRPDLASGPLSPERFARGREAR